MRHPNEIFQKSAKQMGTYVLNFIFPQYCPICAMPVWPAIERPWPICESCEGKIIPIKGKRCGKCGRPLISESDTCMKCRSIQVPYDQHQSVFVYEGLSKQLLIRYKFHGEKSLGNFFSVALVDIIRKYPKESTVVPVPCSRKSMQKRGWDQSAFLVSILGNALHLKSVQLLVRRGAGVQKKLSAEERSKNLSGKIFLRKRKKIPESVILVDDVFTTGATVSECALVLKSAGVKRVFVATLLMDI